MKHYAKEKLDALRTVLEGAAQQDEIDEPHKDVIRMFLTYIAETGREIPGAKMSHKARWRAVLIGALAMRWMVCNHWTKDRLRGFEGPVCAICAIADIFDNSFTVAAYIDRRLETLIRPLVKGLEKR